MSTFIGIGIAETIVVRRRQHETDENLLQNIDRVLPVHFYDGVHFDSEIIALKLKPEILTRHIADFMREQLAFKNEFSSGEPREDVQYKKQLDSLFEILERAKYPEIMQAAKDKHFFDFQYMDYGYLQPSYLMADNKLYLHMLMFLAEGSAFLECYFDLFTYMTRTIRAASKNPLKDTIVVDLIG